MKNKIVIGTLISYCLVLILHLGILYIAYGYFSANLNGDGSTSPALYVLIAVLIISLIYFTWRSVSQYLSISQYLKTADKLKIKIDYALGNVSFSASPLDKFNYDYYFVRGLTGEGSCLINGRPVKIFHLLQSGGIFFPQPGASKLITAFETTLDDPSLCFILRKKNTSEALNSVDSTILKGWEYFFFDKFKKVEKTKLMTNIEDLLPKNVTRELPLLAGKNVVLVQNGKIRLIHLGFLNTVEEITSFSNSLVKMLS